MSNTLNQNPLVITNALTSLITTQGASVGFPGGKSGVQVDEIYWYGPVTAGDTFVVTDSAGNVVRAGKCAVAGQSVSFQQYGRPVTDLNVTQISSGTIYIYFH